MAGDLLQKLIDSNAADARTFAGRLSDTARYIWVGSFGLFFTALMADKAPLLTFYNENYNRLACAAAAGAAAFLADALKNYWGLSFAGQLEGVARREVAAGSSEADAARRYNETIASSSIPACNHGLLTVSIASAAISALLILWAFAHHLHIMP